MLAATCIVTEISADPIVQVTGGLGYSNYEFEHYDTFAYPVLDLGVNVGWSDYFLHIGTSLPISDGTASGSDDIGKHDDSLSRTTMSLNVGYRFYHSLAAFIGINYANSTVDTDYQPNGYGINSVSNKIKELGYHIGLAGTLYQWENYGALNAKGALSLAKMDISYSDNTGQSFSWNSSSGNGYTLGIGWLGLINDSLTYYIDLDLYRYSYKINGNNFKSNETDMKAGIGYVF